MLTGSQSLPPHTAAAAAKTVVIDVPWWGVASGFPLPCRMLMPNLPGVRLRGRRRRDGHVQHRRGTIQF